MTPQISVIIPTYNRAHFLSQTIDNVLAQTFTNYELIVVDDGSTDNTHSIITNYQKKQPQIKYIYQENAGGSAARNLGWQHANADYLFFLDSDDLLLPDALASLLRQAQYYPQAGAVGGGYQYIDAQGAILGERTAWHDDSLDLQRWLTDCPFIPSATLVQREWVAQVAGFDPAQEAAQDWDFWLRLAYAGCRMVWLKQIVCQYRKHGAELTSDPQRQKRGCLRMLDKLFSQPDLPIFIYEQKPKLYANVHILIAAREYMIGNISIAEKELQQAAQLAPIWVSSGILLEKVLRQGQSSILFEDFSLYQTRVLNNLPLELKGTAIVRRAKARLAAAELFSRYHKCEWMAIGPLWCKVIINDITWLTNIGFWKIGLRYLVKRLQRTKFIRKISVYLLLIL